MIRDFEGKAPQIAPTAFVADSAAVIGDVVLGDESSIWFQCVVRGDMQHIRIGRRTNIQDLAVIHVRYKEGPTVVGDDVTVGHRAILHACTIGNRVLVGMGSILLDDVEVGEDSIIGAGAILTPGTVIPPRSFVLGAPALVRRAVTQKEMDDIGQAARRYVDYSRRYKQAASRQTQCP